VACVRGPRPDDTVSVYRVKGAFEIASTPRGSIIVDPAPAPVPALSFPSSTTMSALTSSREASVFQCLRATKKILQDIVFGARYVRRVRFATHRDPSQSSVVTSRIPLNTCILISGMSRSGRWKSGACFPKDKPLTCKCSISVNGSNGDQETQFIPVIRSLVGAVQ